MLYNVHGDFMKVLILSDIHGDYDTLYKITQNEVFDKLIILGDLFSYGFSSNDLNENKIIKLLQKHKKELILIKGNCDTYINFEMLNLFAHDVITCPINGHEVTLTHGNIYSKGFLPICHGDIFISGHTHIPMLIKELGITYANPGSIGKPRGCTKKSYMIFNDNKIIIKDETGNIQKEMEV